MGRNTFFGSLCAAALLCPCAASQGAEDGTRLLHQPAVSKDHLAFVYGGDIWISERDGSRPVQLTSNPAAEFAPHFSPDGKWIAFSANYDNNIDVYVIPVEGGQARRLTWHPAADIVTGWSPDGKRVLFVSNREVANSRSGQFYEVSAEGGGYEHKIMKAVAVEGTWSPDGKRLAYRPYIMAYSGASGWATTEPPGPGAEADGELFRYSFEDRAEKPVKPRLVDVSASPDLKKLLLTLSEGKLEVADANEKMESKPVDLGGLRMFVDPRQEWRQIFDETWRMEQQYFYDPNMHGLDWRAVRARYEPLLDYVQRREDLNELLVEMIGELQVGHNRISGGDVDKERPAGVGLLGADFEIEKNRYRIARIYRGDRWNPFLVGPLAAAGVDAAEDDVILAINGHALDGSVNIFSLLAGTVDQQATLMLSRDGSTHAARTVVVIPIASETGLRQWEWVRRNRDYVDRRNSGGQAANYVLEVLDRKYLSGWKDRDGLILNTPAAAIYGPKAMLIDQDAGSGGDYFPYGFRHLGLGKLIGTRTWGGLIGISANPPLIDGGRLTVPFFRMFTPEGQWRVENEGVAPDVDVALDPIAVNEDRDPQLDAAIAEVLEELKSAKPIPLESAPPMPTQLGK